MSKPQKQLKITGATGSSYLSIKLNRSAFDLLISFGVTVRIKDDGFTGQNRSIGLNFKDYAVFLDDLKKCDETRTGKASLSASSKDFAMKIYNYDGSGHFSLKYFLSDTQSLNNLIYTKHRLTGEFLLDASSMTAMVTEIIKWIPDLATIIERENEIDLDWLKARKINCSHCQNPLFLIEHSPFYDGLYLYCSNCPQRVEVGTYDPIYRQLADTLPPSTTSENEKESQARLMEIVESRLRPCDCGGSFKLTAVRRCLKCRYPLAEASEYDDIWPDDSFDYRGLQLVREDDIWKAD